MKLNASKLKIIYFLIWVATASSCDFQKNYWCFQVPMHTIFQSIWDNLLLAQHRTVPVVYVYTVILSLFWVWGFYHSWFISLFILIYKIFWFLITIRLFFAEWCREAVQKACPLETEQSCSAEIQAWWLFGNFWTQSWSLRLLWKEIGRYRR